MQNGVKYITLLALLSVKYNNNMILFLFAFWSLLCDKILYVEDGTKVDSIALVGVTINPFFVVVLYFRVGNNTIINCY